jgi:uncharacterized membrane protein
MSRLLLKHEITYKTITYCMMHFCVAVMVAFALTQNWALALSIGTIEPLVQTAFFNMHERAWVRARQRASA